MKHITIYIQIFTIWLTESVKLRNQFITYFVQQKMNKPGPISSKNYSSRLKTILNAVHYLN